MRVDVQMRNNAITIQGLRVYLAERYGIRKGNRIKYTERGEEKVEHIYEVDAIYPHCGGFMAFPPYVYWVNHFFRGIDVTTL